MTEPRPAVPVPTAEPAPVRVPRRGRRIAVAGVAAVGLAAGGAWVADASSASGTATPPTPAVAGTAAPVPPKGAPRPGGAYDLDGTVTSASSSRVSVRTEFGTSRTYVITSRTTVHAGPGKNASVSALVTGVHVSVHATKSGSTYTAVDIVLRAAHLDGVVTAIAGDSVTLTDRDGFRRTLTLASSTTYSKDGTKTTRSALAVGSVVRAEGKVDADLTTLDATTVEIRTKDAPAGPDGPRGGGPGGPGRPGGPGHDGPRPPAAPGGAAPSGQPS